MKYWDITKILPYQRHFNLINGERSIGKTYTCQKYFLKKALEKGEEFVYLVRTKTEKGSGAFEMAFNKVCKKEFPGIVFNFTIESLETEDHLQLGYCYALSEYQSVKKRSFPNVRWLLFDEYMIEENTGLRYFNGWKEPNIFLNLYHSIDREEDRLTCFLLGNNTSFYNPYHLHPAFKIPFVKKGEIWVSDNVLFQWAEASDDLKKKRNQNKFLTMVESTDYGKYAVHGDYKDDNVSFISERSDDAKLIYIMIYNGEKFGVWFSQKESLLYVSSKYDPNLPNQFAFTVQDHVPGSWLAVKSSALPLTFTKDMFKKGYIRYENMEIKKKTEGAILCVL